jgi:hypothetical protein
MAEQLAAFTDLAVLLEDAIHRAERPNALAVVPPWHAKPQLRRKRPRSCRWPASTPRLRWSRRAAIRRHRDPQQVGKFFLDHNDCFRTGEAPREMRVILS